MAPSTGPILRLTLVVGLLIGADVVLVSNAEAATTTPSTVTTYSEEALPTGGGGYSFLYGISCPAVSKCVAVGISVGTGENGALVETLDGTTWSGTLVQLSEPNPPLLSAVWCVSTDSCVAVGSYQTGNTDDGPTFPLVETLSDGEWVPSEPAIPKGVAGGDLDTISCTSKTQCVAGGVIYRKNGGSRPLFETLSKGRWHTTVSRDISGYPTANINGIQCLTPHSCLAVGYWGKISSGTSSPAASLVAHLSGRTWTVSKLKSQSDLTSIWCASVSSCIAVGSKNDGESSITETLTGTTWQLAELPGVAGGTDPGAQGISCVRSIRSCVAIDSWYESGTGDPYLMIETLRHGTWSATEYGAPSQSMFPNGISCPTMQACVGIGASPYNPGGAPSYEAEAAMEQTSDT